MLHAATLEGLVVIILHRPALEDVNHSAEKPQREIKTMRHIDVIRNQSLAPMILLMMIEVLMKAIDVGQNFWMSHEPAAETVSLICFV